MPAGIHRSDRTGFSENCVSELCLLTKLWIGTLSGWSLGFPVSTGKGRRDNRNGSVNYESIPPPSVTHEVLAVVFKNMRSQTTVSCQVGVHSRVMVIVVNVLVCTFKTLFSACLRKGKLRAIWKMAPLVLISKPRKEWMVSPS